MKFIRILVLIGGALGCVAPQSAFAQAPVALVEDVTGNPPGVGFMDYVGTGKVIQLGKQDSLVVSYMESCVRETIKGGTVTIGSAQSTVQSGQVVRTKVDCDASKMMHTAEGLDQAAALVFRSVDSAPSKTWRDPQFTIYARSPMMQVNGPGTLLIARLDRPEAPDVKLAIGQEQLKRGAFIDCAALGVSLTPGGTYRVIWASNEVVLKVHPDAKSGVMPVIGRLVRLVPVS